MHRQSIAEMDTENVDYGDESTAIEDNIRVNVTDDPEGASATNIDIHQNDADLENMIVVEGDRIKENVPPEEDRGKEDGEHVHRMIEIVVPGNDAAPTPTKCYVRQLDFDSPNKMPEQEVSDDLFRVPTPTEEKYNVETALPATEELECKDETNERNRIICFVNEDAKISPSPVLQYILDIDQPYDTVISCEDGRVGTHRLVLAAASPFIGSMFSSYDHRLGEVAVLVLPDVSTRTMKTLLGFCYTGKMYFPKEEENEILETMKFLLLGEFGNLTIKEVTIKLPEPDPEPQPTLLESNTDTPQDTAPDAAPTSDSVNNNPTLDAVPMECVTSSSEEESGDDDSSDADDENEACESIPKRSLKHAGMGAKSSSKILSARNPHTNLESVCEVNYLVAPFPTGVKVRTFQCYHCPGTFKSIDTLGVHLENNHGLYLHSRKLYNSEFEILLNCDVCKTKHPNVASANACICKHHRIRCFLCLETIRSKNFDLHIKSAHKGESRNGSYIVKCRWCDAGIVMREPIDNRLVSGHCFSHHFPSSRSGGSGSNGQTRIEISETVKTETPSFSTESLPNPVSDSTPAPSTTTKSKSNTPAILMMLQKASLKRKSVSETPNKPHESHVNEPQQTKRVRHENKKVQVPQVARRTGKPIGRQVNLNILQEGIPNFKSSGRGKTKSITLDVTQLPSIYVHFKYGKTFIPNCLFNIRNPVNSRNRNGSGEIIRVKSTERCSLPLYCF